MTLGTNVSVKEGIKAHFGGIFIDSRTRVRSEGLVNVTKNEKQSAPKIMRRKTVIAYSCPENTQVSPVRKSTTGTIPHNKFIMERPSPSNIYSQMINPVIKAKIRGLVNTNNINWNRMIIVPRRGCLLFDSGLKTNPSYNLFRTVDIKDPSSLLTLSIDSNH